MVQRSDKAVRRVQRRDRVTFKAVDLPPKRAAPGGAWDCAGVFARDGVQLYEDEGKTIREARPRSEVAKSAEAMRALVLTLQHPGDGPDPDHGAQEVTIDNARSLWHGHVIDATADWPEPGLMGGWVRAATAELQAAMTMGTVECSVGYMAVLRDPMDQDPVVQTLVAELGPEPGVMHDGSRYDLIQTQIEPNHLAIVDQARAGSVARLRLDGRQTMKRTLKIDGKTHQIHSFLADAVKAQAMDDAAQAQARKDELDVGPVSIDGTDLILPRGKIDEILALLGEGSTGPSAAEPEPMPADAMDPMADPAMMSDEGDMPEDRSDAEPLTMAKVMDAMQAQIDKRVAASLAKAQPAAAAKIADSVLATATKRANLERDARVVLGPRHDFAGQDDHAIAVQVLKTDGSPRLGRAEQLAEQARKGDLMAAGRLRQMMDDALDRRRDALDSSTELAVAVWDASAFHARTDSQDDETPERDRVRQAKRDAANGAAA